MDSEHKKEILDSIWTEKSEPMVEPTKKSSFNFLKSKKFWKIFGFSFLGLILAIVIWFVGNFLNAWNKISNSSGNKTRAPILSLFKRSSASQLKGEGDGRVNILLVGMGGPNHPGGTLTDTIMVASIDPVQKNLGLLSIPRDLYVTIRGNGKNKINTAYSWGEANKNSTGGGSEVAKQTVGDVLDLPMHYYVKIDFKGFVKFIDTIGGIDVEVPRAISDPYYPDAKMIGYEPFNISAGPHHLDGKTALKYARSRETTSDFDRAKRQQQVIKAAKDKMFSAGVWANPVKITQLFSILGDNVRTDLSANDMGRLIEIVKQIDETKIATKVLDNSEGGPLVSVSNDGYYLVPRSGNFEEIQYIAHEIFTEPFIEAEKAQIEVQNASSLSGAAAQVAKTLKNYGYQVVDTKNAAQPATKTIIYDYTQGKKPYTVNFLKNRYKVQVIPTSRPADTQADIAIVIGEDYSNQ